MTTLHCGQCGCRLAPWENVWSWNADGTTEYLCEDCFDSLFFALSRMERAALIGSEVITAEELLSEV
ncbi:MAG: hypothetical protein EOM54_04230 [Clostridia bacterium]|nr:hypothetical protein [Clostridia bacterium]